MPSTILCFIAELIAILLGFSYWKYMELPYRVAHFQVIIAFLVEVSGDILVGSNGWLFNVYLLFEVLIVSRLGFYFVRKTAIHKIVIPYFILAVMFWAGSVYVKGIDAFQNTYLITYSLVFVLLFLYSLSVNHLFNASKIYKEPMFVLCLAMIVYYGGITPIFGMYNILNREFPEVARNLYNINQVLVALRYSLVAVSFWLCAKQAKRIGYAKQ